MGEGWRAVCVRGGRPPHERMPLTPTKEWAIQHEKMGLTELFNARENETGRPWQPLAAPGETDRPLPAIYSEWGAVGANGGIINIAL